MPNVDGVKELVLRRLLDEDLCVISHQHAYKEAASV